MKNYIKVKKLKSYFDVNEVYCMCERSQSSKVYAHGRAAEVKCRAVM